MEYEIGDDPQGLDDLPEADREGGIREPLFFRKEPRNMGLRRRPEEIVDQMGEGA